MYCFTLQNYDMRGPCEGKHPRLWACLMSDISLWADSLAIASILARTWILRLVPRVQMYSYKILHCKITILLGYYIIR